MIFERCTLDIKVNFQGIEFILRSSIITNMEKQVLQKNYDDLKGIIGYFENLYVTGRLEKELFMKLVTDFYRGLENIRDKIAFLECDLISTIESVIEKDKLVKEIMEKHCIEVVKEYGEGTEVCLIRQDTMSKVFTELLTNLRHAFSGKSVGTNKIKIATKTNPSREFVCISLLDNGVFGYDRKYKRGHYLIKDLVTPYGGRFYPLVEVPPTGEDWRDGYKRKSIVYLVNIPRPQDFR
jgi:hypothetical protein